MDRVWKKQDEGKLQNSAFGGPDTFKAQPGSPPLVHTPQLCTCSPPHMSASTAQACASCPLLSFAALLPPLSTTHSSLSRAPGCFIQTSLKQHHKQKRQWVESGGD